MSVRLAKHTDFQFDLVFSGLIAQWVSQTPDGGPKQLIFALKAVYPMESVEIHPRRYRTDKTTHPNMG